MSNSSSALTDLNAQFYDNEKYDNICDTILYYNKIIIQHYQNELNLKKRRIRNLIEKLLEIC